MRLRIWLNQWTCRIGYPRPGEDDLLADSLATWWAEYKVMLPPENQRLAQLADAQLQSLSSAYAGLYALPAGLDATCGVIEFELGWATRSGAGFDLVRADRDEGYEWLATHDEDWHRALNVQGALWRSGHVRAVGFPGLLIAAVAEREQVTLLHYDSDYDLIAQVTTQPMQWAVPRGTVP